eukprot:scaffold143288_cov136-Phaeocystis_antarctica.AAC.1
MFVFAATLVPRRRNIRHGNVGERENLNPGNHHEGTLKLAPHAVTRWLISPDRLLRGPTLGSTVGYR